MFALHVVRAGVVDVHYSKLFAHLQKFREQADYGPLLALAHEDVAKDLATVKEFAGLVERFWGLPRERNEAGCRTPAGGSQEFILRLAFENPGRRGPWRAIHGHS